MRGSRTIAALVVLAFAAAACGSDDDAATPAAPPAGADAGADPEADANDSDANDSDVSDEAGTGGSDTDGSVESAGEGAAEDEPTAEERGDGDLVDDDSSGNAGGDAADTGVGSAAFDAGGFDAIDGIVQEFVDERELNGAGLVLVERDAGVVYENYWGEFSADHVSYIASSSKMIAAGVLMKLDEDGLLDVDATVADTVEWGAANPDITIAQLVSNTSGLVGLGPDLFYAPYLCQFSPNLELEACGETVFTTPDDDGDIVPPDTEYRYGGAQWQVAGAVAETVSGKTWAELIEEIYVEPCGVDSLGFNNHWTQSLLGYPYDLPPSDLEPTENPQIEGGAYITAPDYAQLVLMHLRDGECPNGQVMSPESIERLHTDEVGPDGAGDPDTGYSFGWWIERDTGYLTDPGLYGAVAFMDPAAGWGGYLVVEADGDTGNELAALLRPTFEAAFVG
jgi:CubicO group peptidase (beta-lactamase class C family)